MRAYEIIYKSFINTIMGFNKLLMIGILLIITTLLSILPIYLTEGTGNISIFSVGVLIFFLIVIIGFFIQNIHNTIHKKRFIRFNWLLNIYEGIRFLFLLLFYFLIPLSIFTIIILVSGYTDIAFNMGNTISNVIFNIINNMESLPHFLSHYIFRPLASSTWALIIILLFSSLSLVGTGRYADEFDIIKGVDLGTIINAISEIWLKYIIWFILNLLIIFLILFLSSYILSNVLGAILYLLLILPFIIIFLANNIGLMYREMKKID